MTYVKLVGLCILWTIMALIKLIFGTLGFLWFLPSREFVKGMELCARAITLLERKDR